MGADPGSGAVGGGGESLSACASIRRPVDLFERHTESADAVRTSKLFVSYDHVGCHIGFVNRDDFCVVDFFLSANETQDWRQLLE